MPKVLYQWKLLPLGMKTSGAVFQRVINMAFKRLKTLKVVVYINEITVFSPTMEQHLVNLNLFFKKLAKANLNVSFTKCVLAGAKLKVLGHLIFHQGIKPNPAKDKAIAQIKPSTNVAGVGLFMGTVIFYGRFIAGVLTIAKPMWALTRGGVVFDWSPACASIFKYFKEALISKPILKLPCWDKLFVIETNASATGIRASLKQPYKGGLMSVLYASQTLNIHKRRYLATK